jgi:methyl-accepting chemotaxis protein
MLGSDIELLTDILVDLGLTHEHYGVKPEYSPRMGRALMYAVGDSLGEEYTQPTRDAWVEVYGAMSYDMIRAQKMKVSVELEG